jgi:hypothetical protein
VSERPNEAPSAHWVALAAQYRANLDWINHVRKAAEHGPVMTANLQREWLSDRPIVFLGVLVDVTIKGTDRDRYILQIRAPDYYLNTELQDQYLALQLECSASDVDPLLESAAQLADPLALAPTIGVVANLSTVRTTKVMALEAKADAEEDVDDQGRPGLRLYDVQEATLKDLKVGVGRCVHVEPYR